MAKTYSLAGTPRLRDAHPDIFPGSPLAVLGIFVDILRIRFSQDNRGSTPYYWASDPTPEATEEGTVESPRKLIIESQYLQHPDSRDVTPALFVERGALSFTEVSMGSRGDHDQRTGQDFYIAQGVMPISILCVSSSRGESMEIGSLIGFYMLSLRPSLREIFGFQDVRTPIVDGTQVYRRSTNDIESWVTPVNTQVTCKYLWIETPIAPKLRELRANLGTGASTQVLLSKDRP